MTESKTELIRANPSPVGVNRLVIIDGFAILHRAYHALPQLTNRQGQPIGAVYGFSTMLLKVISDLNPQYLIVALDAGKPTFRNEQYLGYQSNRKTTDQELVSQLGLLNEVIEAFSIPIFVLPGFEADDLIGTIARQATEGLGARGKGQGKDDNHSPLTANRSPLEVVVVTGDRDLLKLINSNVKVYMPVKGLSDAKLMDESEVIDKMGVKPSQIIDYKGLVGDSSDNYPGVSGIGPKTATDLLEKYKTLENIYKNLDELPEKVREKLEKGKEMADVSKKLATIVLDAPIEFNLDESKMVFDEEQKKKVAGKFREIGFKSLAQRLDPAEHKNIKTEKLKKEMVEDDNQQQLL